MLLVSKEADLKTSVTVCPLSSRVRSRLLTLLWGTTISTHSIDSKAIDTDAYFEYYSQQCDSFSTDQFNAAIDASEPPVKTHQDVLDVVAQLSSNKKERDTIVRDLIALRSRSAADSNTRPACHDEDGIQNSVNWAARLLTMMEIGKIRCAFSSRKPLLWDTGPLCDFLSDVLTPQKLESTHVRLEKVFNAWNLERLAGIHVEWTNDLASHLRLRDDDKRLLIFHHATFLESMLQ